MADDMDVELEQELEMDRMEGIPQPPSSDQVRSLFIVIFDVHILIYPSIHACIYIFISILLAWPVYRKHTENKRYGSFSSFDGSGSSDNSVRE